MVTYNYAVELCNRPCDCSYSGNWVERCAKKLDEIGVLSCGHHTREHGILIRIYCSCRENQQATMLQFCEEVACYDLHLVILQNMEKQLTPQQDLESDIKLWSMTIRDDSITEVTRAVLVTVLYTAKLLLETKALLLPQAAIVFRQNYSIPEEDGDLNLEVRDGTIKFTGKWLMSQLIIHLQPYMGYKCIVPRLGTLLYPRNGDLMKSPNVCIVPVTLQ